MKKWQLLYTDKIVKTSNIIKILLKNRGFTRSEDIEKFLSPIKPENISLDELNIDKDEVIKAIKRIKKAKEANENVVIYTDYDADGISGGTIVWEILHKMGLKVMPYIPHRVEEGYGLSPKGIDNVVKKHNPALIITVDHGITAGEKILYAKSLGIDVIVVDHHVKQEDTHAFALIHTTKLCATGVAWIFMRELLKSIPEEKNTVIRINSYLELVALATIADLVPLVGPNRSFVKFGLQELNNTSRIGLLSLIKESGLQKGKIGVYEIGHMLGPRINAMGRLTHALDAMRLLCTLDEERALELARRVNFTNRERQILTQDTITHAKNLYKLQKSAKLIFIAHESYNQGVIGLVAGKLVEAYYRPAIVISKGEIYSKASARSINGVNIIDMIRKAQDLLVDCGGHPMAAGFTVKTEYIEILQKRLEKIMIEKMPEENIEETLKIDFELDIHDINWNIFAELKNLEPYGISNPQPVFLTKDVRIVKATQVGKEKKHLKLNIRSKGGIEFNSIGFGMGDKLEKISSRKNVDAIYSIEENSWNGNVSLQLNLKDVNIT